MSADELNKRLPVLPPDLDSVDLSLSMANDISLRVQAATGSPAEDTTDVCVVIDRDGELGRVCMAKSFIGGLMFFSYDDTELRTTTLYALTTSDVDVVGGETCSEVVTVESRGDSVRLTGCTLVEDSLVGSLIYTTANETFETEVSLPEDRFEPVFPQSE